MYSITFPKEAGKLAHRLIKKYYEVYYTYLLNVFKYMGCKIKLCNDSSIDDAKFIVHIDKIPIIIDYSDFLNLAKDFKNYPYYFKFHYVEDCHNQFSNVYPFTPVSFYDWTLYFEMRDKIQYKCNTDALLNRQKPYGNAKERRTRIQMLLRDTYKDKIRTHPTNQLEFWNEINNCLLAIFVPGCREDMLDRGQNQFFALGCCTISPKLTNVLPFYKKIVPGFHYVECKSDYSDLVEKIEWCRTNKQVCTQIGQNVKKLWNDTSTPISLVKWICEVVGV